MKSILTIALLTILTSCQHLEQKARDASAGLQGSIIAAQAKYHDTCVADSTQTACQDINRAIAGENALVTSIETYCGWSVTVPPADLNAKCVPVQSAQDGLNAAIANAQTLSLEIRGMI
jgi:hypothetical protein